MGLFNWLSNLLGKSPAGNKSSVDRGSVVIPELSEPRPESKKRGPIRLNGLDAQQFAPLEDNEARELAKSLGRSIWNDTFFGRRDLIPPTSDARTLLVDRMMIADGITTADELAEIHAVGLEMDRLRPQLAHAAARADRAVASNRQARAERKARKKSEAADRLRLRAEAIAERKLNSIDFLGRGVSRGLPHRQSDAQLLEQRSLPVLHTPADLAQAMQLTISELRWLAFHSEATERIHYVQFAIRKKSGGVRLLASPHLKLRTTHRWILANILSKIPLDNAAHGFVVGRGIVSNAQPHVGKSVVVNVDLADFFPSITFPRVAGLFRGLGYSGAVATILGLLVTECPRQRVRYAGRELWVASGPRSLPQGACTSPAISNAIAWRLDHRLAAIASKLDWTYTRYADDLTFSTSGDNAEKIGYLLARLRHICENEGFRLNHNKTRVQRRNMQQSVTGVVVNDRCGVSRKVVRQLRAILHNAKQTGLAAQNRDGHPDFQNWLQGMIAYVHMVNPDQALPLKQKFEQIIGS